MPEYIPPLVGTIGLGELSAFPNEPVERVHTYIQVDKAIAPKFLGVYFRGYENRGSETQMIGDILYYKIETIYDWTDPRDYDYPPPKSIVIASNINFSEVLSGSEGWKWIEINPVPFESNTLYLISFYITTTLPPYETIDTINVASRDLCPLGPEGPPGEKRIQSDQSIEMVGGQGYRNPIALALSEETPAPPPPVEMKIPWILLAVPIVGGIIYWLYKRKK